MGKIFLNTEAVQKINFLEQNTGAKVKDCIIEKDLLTIIVLKGDAGKVIGPKGSNVKSLQNAFKKKIRVIEFDEKIETFIKNLVAPELIKNVIEKEGIVTINPSDNKARGYLIGKNAETLRSYEELVKRYHPIKEIRVAYA